MMLDELCSLQSF